jgi:hypothetical protein
MRRTQREKAQAMAASYGRAFLSAVVALAMTGNYAPDDLLKAGIAAVLPMLLRWLNPNDPAFGRGA